MNKKIKIGITAAVYLLFILWYFFSEYEIFIPREASIELFMPGSSFNAEEYRGVIRVVTTISIVLCGLVGFMVHRYSKLHGGASRKFSILIAIVEFVLLVVLSYGTARIVYMILGEYSEMISRPSSIFRYCWWSLLLGQLLADFAFNKVEEDIEQT